MGIPTMRGTPGSRHFEVGSSRTVNVFCFLAAHSWYGIGWRAGGRYFVGGSGCSGGAPASPVILTPPACHVPVRSGFPSAVRGRTLVACAYAVPISSAVAPINMQAANRCLTSASCSVALRPGEFLRAVREGEFTSGAGIAAVSGLVSGSRDGIADLEQVACKPGALQSVRRITLQGPRRYFSAGVLHIEIDIDMRVGPLDLADGPCQGDQLVRIILCRERVMSPDGRRAEEADTCHPSH